MKTTSNSNIHCANTPADNSDLYKFGEQLGDVLRGLLGVRPSAGTAPAPAPAPTPAPAPGAGQKYLLVDATETGTGVSVSLDANFDVAKPLADLTGDAVFSGVAVFASGARTAMKVVIAQKYASVLSLRPIAGQPDTFKIFAEDEPQPLEAPHIIMLDERVALGTNVARITGQVLDPKNNLRVNFSITHDPAPVVVAGIVAGIAAVICGAVVLTEALIDNCTTQGVEQCGKGKVKKITVNRTYGFSWNKGSPKVGCGQDCEIECK